MKQLFSAKATRVLTYVLIIGFVSLAVLHFAAVALELYAPGSPLARFTPWFDLDVEHNIPTFYSGAVLLGIGLVSLLRAFKARNFYPRAFWSALGIFFTYWALDEVLVLHERIAEPLRHLLQIGQDSVFYHAWVLVAIAAIAFLSLITFILLRYRLPHINKKQINLLGVIVIFMSGIVILEIAGTKLYATPALYRFGAVAVEELFEIGMASYLLIKIARY